MSTTNDDDATRPGEAGASDYLWDKSGPPDPEIVALENALSPRRWSGRLPEALEPAPLVPLSRRDRVLRLLPRALAASLIAAAVLFGGLAAWHGLREPHAGSTAPVPPVAAAPTPYSIDNSEGAWRIEDTRVSDGALVPGTRLVTQADARVRLRVGQIGTITLEPETRLRIEEPAAGGTAGAATDGEYLLWLERGTISATIYAAPRLFQLGTPSGIAVDMGCAYTATVDESGVTRLSVTLGQVSFETPQRKVLVPEGASTRAWPGRGPGTPVRDDAPAEFREAVEWIDEMGSLGRLDELRDPSQFRDSGGRNGSAMDKPAFSLAFMLSLVLGTERSEDSLSLWHLLDCDYDVWLRGQVYDRLVVLVPPPDGVTREGCLSRDPAQLLAWRDAMGWAWPAGTSSKLKGAPPAEGKPR